MILSSSPDLPTLLQHLTTLLAAPDLGVAFGALVALIAFLRKTHHGGVRWQGTAALAARLVAMCKGWGGKEEVGLSAYRAVSMLCYDENGCMDDHNRGAAVLQGLELAACVQEDDAAIKQVSWPSGG